MARLETARRGRCRGKALRLLAWARLPEKRPGSDNKGSIWVLEESFPCAELCRRTGGYKLDPHRQAGYNCCLPGYRGRWTGEYAPRVYMGGHPRYEDEGQNVDHPDWQHPLEDMSEGCPGGWYRCGFVESLQRYRRERTGDGLRVDNLFLNRCEDPLVLEAIQYLEGEERRMAIYFDDKRYG